MKPTSARLRQANFADSGRPDRLSEGTNKLFVYGTLLLDDVVNTLIGRIPDYQDALAPGWRVVHLPNRNYPGLVEGQGEANGKVFADLMDAEWATLDAFEDSAYTLAAVRVLTPLETDTLAYIWRGEYVDQLWSTAEFGRNELADYLDRCRNWRRRYDERVAIGGRSCAASHTDMKL